jgi:hypothetical protein
MIGIVVSRADEASRHIGEQLLAVGEWTAHEDDSRDDSDGGGTYYTTEGSSFGSLRRSTSNSMIQRGRFLT